MIEISLTGVVALAISTIVFFALSMMVLREYNNDDMRREFGYRLWSVMFAAEAGVWFAVFKGVI